MGIFEMSTLEKNKLAAWTKCQQIPSQPSRHARIDDYGNVIRRQDDGTQGEYGWEIDHIHPSALGGLDDVSNLRALHWRANRSLDWRANRSLGGALGSLLR